MRHILAPILLLVFLFPALAHYRGTTMDDLVVMNGLHYKKFTDVPFTGKVTGEEQGSFRNGKRHGPWVSYNKDGRIKEKVTYKNGERDGLWVSYWDNGELYSKGTFKDGKMDGPWVGYNKNGQLSFKGTYKDGVKISD